MTFLTYLAYGLAYWTLTSLVATLILGTIGYRWNKRREAAGRPVPRGGFLRSA
ncbi:hypothetical protein [Allomesorhizobium camelthorni]|uniref:Uncharacterized protein n=1 Tax=Allomesorhizobium camelthorni TaxID=475069 RepID=A0A6G4WMY2_9HYPH|nr:hypothetical protein [Mesorhizobium camelthorni]NGO55556.1 hypothetical protein [Mesorhizobium camelthorni]